MRLIGSAGSLAFPGSRSNDAEGPKRQRTGNEVSQGDKIRAKIFLGLSSKVCSYLSPKDLSRVIQAFSCPKQISLSPVPPFTISAKAVWLRLTEFKPLLELRHKWYIPLKKLDSQVSEALKQSHSIEDLIKGIEKPLKAKKTEMVENLIKKIQDHEFHEPGGHPDLRELPEDTLSEMLNNLDLLDLTMLLGIDDDWHFQEFVWGKIDPDLFDKDKGALHITEEVNEFDACLHLMQVTEEAHPHLTELIFENIYPYSNHLPSTIRQFRNLYKLKIIGTQEKKTLNLLPDWCGELASLKTLEFEDMRGLEMLPDSFKRLSKLESLSFYGCCNLGVDGSVSNVYLLKQLTSLDLGDCGLQELSPQIGELKELKVLNLGGRDDDPNDNSNTFTELPPEIGQLNKLQTLGLKSCRELRTLPSEISELKSLKDLFLDEAVLINPASHVLEQLKDYKGNLYISNCNLSPEDFGRLIKSQLPVSKLFRVY